MSNETSKTVDYFYNKIVKGFEDHKIDTESTDPFEYIMDITGITTYDSHLDTVLAFEIATVIDAILHQTHRKLLDHNYWYKTYISIVNMPFIFNALNWGMSIRFAWFDDSLDYMPFTYMQSGWVSVDENATTDEIVNFFTAFLKFTVEQLEIYGYGDKWENRREFQFKQVGML